MLPSDILPGRSAGTLTYQKGFRIYSKAFIPKQAEPTRPPPKQNPTSLRPSCAGSFRDSEGSTRLQILVAALQAKSARLREGHKHIQANLTLAEQERVETTTQVKKMEDMHHRVNLLEKKSCHSHY